MSNKYSCEICLTPLYSENTWYIIKDIERCDECQDWMNITNEEHEDE